MRVISRIPNKQGLIELGPCDHGFAMGDTLTITPLAAALGQRAVMLMPRAMERFAFFFNGLCPVRITDNYPLFPWARGNAGVQKLAMFGFHTHSPLARINLSPEVAARGREFVRAWQNPIAFVPTCSAHWGYIRQRPAPFWVPVVKRLAQRYTVCQFGRRDYPDVPGARRMPFVDLETLAGAYQQMAKYIGVDTGDYHLMIAVGGRCAVAEPEPMPRIQADFWLYESPRIEYAKLSSAGTVLEAVERLGF